MPNVVKDADFAWLRQNARLYVDKTWFIEDFLRDPAHPGHFRAPADATLFTRPDRFGKTLFLTMLAEFFDMQKNSRTLFDGLHVAQNEPLCRQCMNKYPVIFLCFGNERVSDFDSALRAIGTQISGFCQSNRHLLESGRVHDCDKARIREYIEGRMSEDKLQGALRVLTDAMASHCGQEVILLIDDHDAPLAAAERHGCYRKMSSFLSGFYLRALKSNAALDFAVLTGKLSFSSDSIFTGHNVVCFDIAEERYADLFGLTQVEVDHLLAMAGLEERSNEVRELFGGFHVGERTDIYNPASVMRHLMSLQEDAPTEQDACLANTYKRSGEHACGLIHTLAENGAERVRLFALLGGNPVAVKIDRCMTWRNMHQEAQKMWTLLYLSGCLTTAGSLDVFPDGVDLNETVLAVPNKESLAIFQQELEAWLAKVLPPLEQQALCDALWSRNVQALERLLDNLFVGSGVQALAKTHGHVVVFFGCHGMLSGILAMRCKEVASSGEGGKDFRDILVVDQENSRAAVLKLTRVGSVAPIESVTELEQHAQKVLKQIEERALDARVRAEGGCTTVLHVGIAFCDHKTRVLIKDAGV